LNLLLYRGLAALPGGFFACGVSRSALRWGCWVGSVSRGTAVTAGTAGWTQR